MKGAIADLSFPHNWTAEMLPTRPLILPPRHFTYPRDAEEVERGALEVLVRPSVLRDEKVDTIGAVKPFLATCALGFRDPAVPTGLWACPNPDEICAVSGGYGYVIDTTQPQQFIMIPYRPVLELRALPDAGLLLFVGHRSMLAWGSSGQAWESVKLSDEGLTITSIDDGILRGLGWSMLSDKETPFALELTTGERVQLPSQR